MSMSSAGRAASSSDCVGRPRALEIGLSGFAVQIRPSSLTGSYAMATAEHREPYESRGSRTVLGAPGGESPPGDSTNPVLQRYPEGFRLAIASRTQGALVRCLSRAKLGHSVEPRNSTES